MMTTVEMISHYPFFADLTQEQIAVLASVAEGITAQTGDFIFHENDELCCFYIVVEGAVGIVMEAPQKPAKETEKTETKDIVFSAIGPGGAFAWSALVPPHKATASAKALTPCWLIAFDCNQLTRAFENDCEFGYRMMMKVAQVSRDRLRDTRIESLVFTEK